MSRNTPAPEIEPRAETGFFERHGQIAAFGTVGSIAGTGAGLMLVEVAKEQNELILPTVLVTVAMVAVAGAFFDRHMRRPRRN